MDHILSKALALLVTLAVVTPVGLAAVTPDLDDPEAVLAPSKAEGDPDGKANVAGGDLAIMDEKALRAAEIAAEPTGGGVGINAACPDAITPTDLASGVGVAGTDTTGSYGAPDCHYRISVASPGGMRLRVVLATTEDHDLFVKLGTPATASPYACSATGTSAASETCSTEPLSVGDYYIRVSRWTAGSNDFTVTAFVEPIPITCGLGSGTTPLGAGVPISTTVTLDLNAKCFFSFAMPAGMNLAKFTLTPSNATNNVNLYTQYNVAPTVPPAVTSAACSSTLTGAGVDRCNLTGNGQTMYVTVLRPAAGTGDASFTLQADAASTCSLGTGVVALTNGVSQLATLTADMRANCLFSFAPASLGDLGRVNETPVTDNFDLRVAVNVLPTFATTTVTGVSCSSSLSLLSTDSCSLSAGAADTLYALVFRPVAGTVARDFNVRADAIQTCSLGTATTPLSSGIVATASLTADVGAACPFVFTPPLSEDTVRFSMTPGGTANFDLYVRRGAPPTTTTYDCRPFISGTENCTLSNDGADLYAMVRRSSGSGSFTIVATAFSPCSLGNGDTLLAENTPVAGALTSDAGAACFFKFDAASGFDLAGVTMTPETGDFDLYVRTGSRPTTSSYTCRSILGGAVAESCRVSGEAGTIYAMVIRTAGSGAFSVVAQSLSSCSLGPGIHALTNGVAMSAALTGTAGAKCYFSFDPDTAADFAQFVLPATTPSDFDMYVKKGALPTTGSYDCRPYLGGSSQESCNQFLSDSTTQYAMVRYFSGAGGSFSLTATNVVIPVLNNLEPVVAQAAHKQFSYWKVVVPELNAAGLPTSQIAVSILGDPSAIACNALDGTAGAGTCAAARNADATTCTNVNALNPGTCAAAYQAGADACAAANSVNPGTCTGLPDVQVATPPDADLYIRYATGLPTLTSFSCRSWSIGSVDACVLSSELRAQLNDAQTQYTGLRGQAGPLLCPDPAVCQPNPLPTTLGVANVQVLSYMGAGRYFVGVYGYAGPADYVITAAYV